MLLGHYIPRLLLRTCGTSRKLPGMNARSARSLIVVLVGVLVGVGCGTRAPARSFADLQQRVGPGQIIYVVDETGTETRGTLTNLSSTQLSLEVNNVPRQFDEARVRQVQRYGDSLWSGALIGLGLALPGVFIADPHYKPCSPDAPVLCPKTTCRIGWRLWASLAPLAPVSMP